jgi:hypothetical protein
MDQEIWKKIDFTGGKYKISNHGNCIGPMGIIKPTLLRIGYLSIAISFGNRKVKRFYVHRLVAQYFLGDIGDDEVVNHINHSKTDNRLENLEIVKRKTNAAHWAKNGRSVKAGRKKSEFCGRGHKFIGNKRYCLECRKHKYTPPSEYRWKKIQVEGYLVSNNGLVWSEKTKRILKFGVNTPGYKYINLRIDGRTDNFSISRLVYEAFVGPIPKGEVVDHINSDKHDNRVENLRILTKSKNSIASRNKMRYDKKHGFKLSESDVEEIKWLLLNTNYSQLEIAEKFGVHQSRISDIKLGHQWNHVKPKSVDDN